MRPAPSGFTLIELMTVIVLMSAMALFALPKFTVLRERGNLSGARQQIEAAIVTARSTAIQKGRPAQIVINNNAVSVTTTTPGGSTMYVVPATPLDSVYGVKITPNGTLAFDARGFANPRLLTPAIIRVLGSTRRDSVCITVIGQLMPRGCTL